MRAATGPNGKILRIDASGKTEVAATLPDRHVMALAGGPGRSERFAGTCQPECPVRQFPPDVCLCGKAADRPASAGPGGVLRPDAQRHPDSGRQRERALQPLLQLGDRHIDLPAHDPPVAAGDHPQLRGARRSRRQVQCDHARSIIGGIGTQQCTVVCAQLSAHIHVAHSQLNLDFSVGRNRELLCRRGLAAQLNGLPMGDHLRR